MKTELSKQAIITIGGIAIALIGAWSAVLVARTNREVAPPARPASESTVARVTPPPVDTLFVSQFVYPPEQIRAIENSVEGSRARRPADTTLKLTRVAFGRVGNDRAFLITVSFRNADTRPVALDITSRFFVFEDDQGRGGALITFCCEAQGQLLGAGQQREIRLLYRAPAAWFGKESAPRELIFRVEGLLPVVRATWSFMPLRTAA